MDVVAKRSQKCNPGHLGHSLVTILTKISWLLFLIIIVLKYSKKCGVTNGNIVIKMVIFKKQSI
jgi:hypothetical protein